MAVASLSLKDEALAAIDKAGVVARQRYRHYENQKVYTVIAVGIQKAGLEPTVAYSTSDGIVWFTPMVMFIGRALQGDALVKRFTLVED